ncbi:MAG TPA: choice-of-anchor B family protein [Chitinophagales bacterium]|nr:choice-of-anchor B family protein [Chitinophagales bacterium]
MKKISHIFLLLLFFSSSLLAQQNMTFLGKLTYSNDLGSLWGYADGNGHEYALVGAYNGLSIVDVTIPTNPTQVQFVSTSNSFWHEVKTWSHYAYVVNESGGGLLIVDLANLPNAVTSVNWTGGSLGLSTGHTLFIDENGIAYINGSNVGAGGVLFLNLNTNPMNPTHIGTYTNGYVHDCFVRHDTMWTAQIYSGQFKVVNVANKSAPVILATQSTPGNFTHNTALSNNGKYLYTTDEVSNSYVTAYNVSSLSNISEADRFQANPGTNSIAHNVHVKGNFLVTAYYRDGVILTDASDPSNLVKVGYYDTSPQSGSGYTGCWEAYPYLPSGNILAADIEEGLFVLGANYVPAALLNGKVTDYTGGGNLNGVSISIVGASNTTATSDLSGNYKTGYGTAGTYSVTFTKSGYYTKTITGVTLTSGVTTTLNTTLKKTTLSQCVVPTGLFVDNATGTSAKLHWSDEYSNLYTVTLKTVSTGATQTLTSPTNSLTVTGLLGCKSYKFKVKAKCTVGGNTNFSPFYSFTSGGLGCKEGDDVMILSTDESATEEVSVYPNPFNHEFDIAFTLAESAPVLLTITDASGRIIKTINNESLQAGKQLLHVDAAELAAGFYVCVLQTGDKVMMKKMVKSE